MAVITQQVGLLQMFNQSSVWYRCSGACCVVELKIISSKSRRRKTESNTSFYTFKNTRDIYYFHLQAQNVLEICLGFIEVSYCISKIYVTPHFINLYLLHSLNERQRRGRWPSGGFWVDRKSRMSSSGADRNLRHHSEASGCCSLRKFWY